MSNKPKKPKKEKQRMQKFVQKIETGGNKLPSPWLFFVYGAVIVLILAHFLKGTTFQLPGSEEERVITSLLNADGFRFMLSTMVENFTSFPPIGYVLPLAIAVGVGDKAGLFEALAVGSLRNMSNRLLTASVIFIAINSSLATDARYAIIIPACATLYLACGRNPLIGIMAGYAGCSAGLSACLVINAQDAALAGLTASAAQLLPVTSDQPINPASNWYFMMVSTFVLTIAGTIVTEKFIAPLLEKDYVLPEQAAQNEGLTDQQRRGLKFAGIATLVFVAVLLALSVPENGLLRDPEAGTILPKSPLIDNLVPIMTIFFLVVGIAYGAGARTIRGGHQIASAMGEGCASMSSFLVVCFFAAQFMAYFNETNLATFCAVKGSNLLQSINLQGVPLIVVAILLITVINLFIGSSTAKWALLSVILVPMLGLMGFTPAFTQVVYRIGDSVTNTVTPLNYYYPFILGLMVRYKKDAGVGTIIAYQLPYAITFLITWLIMLVIWFLLGLPLGPGAESLI